MTALTLTSLLHTNFYMLCLSHWFKVIPIEAIDTIKMGKNVVMDS